MKVTSRYIGSKILAAVQKTGNQKIFTYVDGSVVVRDLVENKDTFIEHGVHYVQQKDYSWKALHSPPHEAPTAQITIYTPEEIESLRLIHAGKAWKVSYTRLESLIERGWVNSTGTKLTEYGLAVLT